MVAVKLALVALAGTVTDPGTATALLLLDRFTTNPLPPAAAVSVSVQVSVPAPVIELWAHDSELRAALFEPGLGDALPVPWSLILSAGVAEELLETVNCPVEATATVGSYCTTKV